MERIQHYAEVSVRRAVGIALLAIFSVMMGFSQDWVLAFRAGAILLSLLSGGLLYCAWRAPRKDYRDREVWLLLDQWHGLQEQRAHAEISAVMREIFVGNAERAGWAAIVMWLLAGSSLLVTNLSAAGIAG